VLVDGAGRFHLLSLGDALGIGAPDDERTSFLKHWIWSGDRWNASEILETESVDVERGLSGAVAPSGDLSVIFTGEMVGPDEQEPLPGLFFSSQQLDLPAIAPTPLPTLTPTATPIPESLATAEPTPTPRAVFSPDADQGGPLSLSGDSNNPLSSSLLGIILAGLVVLIVFFVGVRILRRERH